MSSEILLSNLVPFAGSGLVGYAIGFALKIVLTMIYNYLHDVLVQLQVKTQDVGDL